MYLFIYLPTDLFINLFVHLLINIYTHLIKLITLFIYSYNLLFLSPFSIWVDQSTFNIPLGAPLYVSMPQSRKYNHAA